MENQSAIYRAETQTGGTGRKAVSSKYVHLYNNADLAAINGNPDKCFVGTLNYGGNDAIIIEHKVSTESGYELMTIKGAGSFPLTFNNIKPAIPEDELHFDELYFEGWEITMAIPE